MERPTENELSEQEFADKIYVFYSMIRELCWGILRDIGLAEDATQETMLKAWSHFNTFRGECEIKTWLIRIAMNTSFETLRRRRSRPEHSMDEVDVEILSGSSIDPFTLVVSQECFRECNRVVWKLPEKYCVVLLLRYIQDLSVEETATALNVSKQCIKSRTLRAMSMARARLSSATYHLRPPV